LFVAACDTPLTIGIQGDWGSGKTSLMNLIRAGLGEGLATVWINTWKYAQLNHQLKVWKGRVWLLGGYDGPRPRMTSGGVSPSQGGTRKSWVWNLRRRPSFLRRQTSVPETPQGPGWGPGPAGGPGLRPPLALREHRLGGARDLGLRNGQRHDPTGRESNFPPDSRWTL
jgi:hypothetical protein